MSGMGKEHEELPQENKQDICQEHKGNNGGNGGNGNGTGKASLKQVRYLKDLCQELNVKPAIELAGISREQASQHITNLEKMRLERSRN